MKAWKCKQRFKKKKEAGVEKNSYPISHWSKVSLVYIMQLIFQKGRELLILNMKRIIKSRIGELLHLYPEWGTKFLTGFVWLTESRCGQLHSTEHKHYPTQ